MSRNLAVVFTLLVVSLAVWVGYLGSTRVQYFPDSFFVPVSHCGSNHGDGWPIVNEVEAEWYPEYWRAAGEPSLYLASRDSMRSRARTLRFTYLPSFDAAIIVRIDPSSRGGLHMTATRMGPTGLFGRTVSRRQSRDLTHAEQRELETSLIEARPFDLSPPNDCDSGLDGERWILEESGTEGYRYINRWSPQEGPVRDVGSTLLRFTGWRPVFLCDLYQ